jgi:RNA polymerase sigma-70 factor (ECF subfamily)
MEDSDATLMNRARRGDAVAFTELAGRHQPRLVRSIALMIGDADEAESLAQEALTRAFAQLDEFRDELPVGPWLRGIALNLCRNYLRSRARHAKLMAPDDLGRAATTEGQPGVLSEILRREMGDRALSAISQLPVALREAFVLHFVEDMDYAAMSVITGVAPGTLRVRAHRARTLLRADLGPVVDTWLRQGEAGE